ncbi:hypothetical protein J6590_089249, partial [Homalodisca vitripennis]
MFQSSIEVFQAVVEVWKFGGGLHKEDGAFYTPSLYCVRLESCQRGFNYFGSTLYNNIPCTLKQVEWLQTKIKLALDIANSLPLFVVIYG